MREREQPPERRTDSGPIRNGHVLDGRSNCSEKSGSAVLIWCCASSDTLLVAVLSHMPGWRTDVTVEGRVVRVRARRGGGWRVRLAETGGALAAAEIRASSPVPLPPIGALIVLRGEIRYDEEHRWYVVDPLEEWLDAGAPSAAVRDRVQ